MASAAAGTAAAVAGTVKRLALWDTPFAGRRRSGVQDDLRARSVQLRHERQRPQPPHLVESPEPGGVRVVIAQIATVQR